jgi:magnesium-transporting ATPase (P-type)
MKSTNTNTMIDAIYKKQPVAAFYKLLASNLTLIVPISLFMALISYFSIKLILLNNLGESGVEKMMEIFNNPSNQMSEQSKLLQAFIVKNPSIMPAFFAIFVIIFILTTYLFYVTQNRICAGLLKKNDSLLKAFIPNKTFLKVISYVTLTFGFITFSSGFIALSIASNPILGLIAALFLCLLIIRSILFLPGLFIGEMNFMESIKYAFQTINLGRAFKILVFGFITFFMISILLSLLFYYPIAKFPHISIKIIANFLVFYLQLACISIGSVALFVRYGHFESEKIAEG